MRRSHSLLAIFALSLLVLLSSFAIGIFFSTSRRSQLPSVYDNYLAQGDELLRQGDYRHAAERYRIASLINREDPTPLVGLAASYERIGRTAEAEQARQRATLLGARR